MLMKPLMIIGGTILLFVGTLSMLTPIPGGTLAIVVGAGLIICASTRAANFVKKYRTKFGRFNRIVTWLENKMGEKLSQPLRRTRPDELPVPTSVT